MYASVTAALGQSRKVQFARLFEPVRLCIHSCSYLVSLCVRVFDKSLYYGTEIFPSEQYLCIHEKEMMAHDAK